MDYDCLILTPWMANHAIAKWHESIHQYFSGKIEVLEEYEETVSSPSITLQIPAVARLKKFLPRHKNDVKFSRMNVYTRDNYSCQYCGDKKAAKQLTYDHVIPRAKGGRTVWENIATACQRCNMKKDDRTPEEAKMRLLKRPVRPTRLPMSATLLPLPKIVPELWLPYLGTQTSAHAG